MNKDKPQTQANRILKPLQQLLKTSLLLLPLSLMACSSVGRKSESVHDIVVKETALIEKIKLERAAPEICQAVEQNEALKKAEAHLALSLEALLKASEVIETKLLVDTKEEVKFERHEASSR